MNPEDKYLNVIIVQNNPVYKNISKNIETLKEYLKDGIIYRNGINWIFF